MAEEQSSFKVVDRRPFNPDGTPRELSPEEQEAADRAAPPPDSPAPPTTATPTQAAAPPAAPPADARAEPPEPPRVTETTAAREQPRSGRDPLDDPASFISLMMSLASNAAASLGMMPHPVTGETGVDLKTAKHWIDVLGMLESKTAGNRDPQEEQMLEGLLADLRMQYVSFSGAPAPPPSKFSASDITGGR
jgi:hypothetical protein